MSAFLSIASIALALTSLLTLKTVDSFSLIPSSSSCSTSIGRIHQQRTTLSTTTCLQYSVSDEADDEEDDDDEDEDDFIDSDSLGDWRNFRRSLAVEEKEKTTLEVATRASSVSKENRALLQTQNEQLHNEYMSGVWAHETSTAEVGGLVARMPLEMEIFRNHKHSVVGRRLKKMLDGEKENLEMGTWYARAKRMIEEEMKGIAGTADEKGQIDAARLQVESTEMLSLYLDNQETWQEICLVLEKDATASKTLVLNRPMAFKLTENLGRLVLNGAFQGDLMQGEQKDLMRFMMAFSSECAVYVGGPDKQGDPAVMIHGIEGLAGAEEISPGSNIYRGGFEAAIEGVLTGIYSPLEFRFFVGCHKYEEPGLDVAVRLGKYQPIACARSVALKQCIGLPKPLWHEVLELCGGDLGDLSTLELLKRDDLQVQLVDETDYDDDDEIPDELGELENFDDEDDENFL